MATYLTYSIDRALYSNSERQISLITTEYKYKSDILVHQQIGKNLRLDVNDSVSHYFKLARPIQHEIFLHGKSYGMDTPKPITRSTFERKLEQLDLGQTAVLKEMLVEHSYIDKKGQTDKAQIVVTITDDEITASIEFRDDDHREYFISPIWLIG